MRRLADGDHACDFRCARGEEQADFLRTKAILFERTRFGRLFVMPASGSVPILGFYAICMARVNISDLPEDARQLAPHNVMPVALLAQLARDDRAPAGTGGRLIADALKRIVRVSDEIGCAGVILDAKNPRLEEYYARIGFERIGTSKNPTRRMFLRLDDVVESQGFVHRS